MLTEDGEGRTGVLDVGQVKARDKIQVLSQGDVGPGQVFHHLVNDHQKGGQYEVGHGAPPFKRIAAGHMAGRGCSAIKSGT